MKLCKTIFLGCILWYAMATAQNDAINSLEKVVIVADTYVKKVGVGQKRITVTNQALKKNITNPTETLRFNSPVAIRDYGNGGTSSIRFRGTSASNTAVMWNGININAVGSGQTDLNSLSIAMSDQLIVKSGGGSVKYGSGAIGGTIHLNDVLRFKKHQDFEVFSSLGSFNTTSNYIKANVGTDKWTLKLASTFNQSDNDYKLIDSRYEGLKNENGAYSNYGVSLSFGYQFSENNRFSFYTTAYEGDRLLSGELPNPSTADDKYQDINQRNLLVWELNTTNFNHTFKGAYLTQEYRYFANKINDDFDFGRSKTYLFNYDLEYEINKKSRLNLFVDLQNIHGKGSNILNKIRRQYSFAVGYNIQLVRSLKTNIVLKKEFNSSFSVPVVFSVGNEYLLNDFYHLLLNVSTNYNVPTFNDLYWPGQGNTSLIPETSKQIDVGYQYHKAGVTLKTMFFYTSVADKIIWTPNTDESTLGVWTPVNLNKSFHSGVELYGKWRKKWNKIELTAVGNYIYTIAKDTDKNKYLIFVPKHLFNANFNFQYKHCSFYVQNLTQNMVFTTDDNVNDSYSTLQGFSIFNLGGLLKLWNKAHTNLGIGFSIKNIFNQLYYFSIARPMPGRNFNININYKF